MCGRFFLSRSGAEIARHFDLSGTPAWSPRFNVAPGQDVPVVRARAGEGEDGRVVRTLELRRWGLVPHWAKAPRSGRRPINARAETAATQPLFRDAFARHRGLVPADGFYEWQHRGRSARPFAVRLDGGALFAMAALFAGWGTGDERLETCAILTTEANETIRPIHDRMPVIVAPEDFAAWLDPATHEATALAPLLRPWPAERTRVAPVGPRVNDVAADDPGLLEPEQDLFTA